MIRSYLKTATRNILKRKMYSSINTFGLSIGIAFCILIVLFIRDEKSFDQFHENKHDIYRVEAKEFNTFDPKPDNQFYRMAYLQTGMKQALKDELPEVMYGTRFSRDEAIFRAEDKVFTEEITYVDADFFKMFSFATLKGNRDEFLSKPTDVVLTQPIAEKYFGENDPLGKTIVIDFQGEKSFTVVGVMEAPPANSSFDFQILVQQENRPWYQQNLQNFGNFNTPTFVQLRKGADMELFSRNMDKVVDKYMGAKIEKWRKEATIPIPEGVKMFELVYTPLPAMHMTTEPGWHKSSDPKYSVILGSMAGLIMLIACINYISLALTTSAARKTEVGIRKVVGAKKDQLIAQFGVESITLALLSMVIGFVLVILFLPAFNQFTKKEIEIFDSNILVIAGAALVITVVVGVIAGSYPSLFLSGFKPVQVLKGGFTSRLQTGFTRPLVVLQFALSAFLIISSVVMYQQMKYITTKDLGYDQSQVVVIRTQTGYNKDANRIVERFRSRSQQERSILSVAGTSASFNRGYYRTGYKLDGENKTSFVYSVDSYYLPLLEMKLVEGRNFTASDTTAIIVNEALVKDMKWTDPLNQYLNWTEDKKSQGSKVIGVVKDFHYQSLQRKIEPMLLSMDVRYSGYLTNIMVKIAPGEISGAIDKIKDIWFSISPDKPFDYTFLDDDVAMQYELHTRSMSIMGFATGFAILISCLGLFGLAGINALNKTKEIGIRKVMGAELGSIFVLLNRQYVWLSLVAFIIAAPLSYFIMMKWLSDFQFRIEIGWEIFVLSMAGGLMIALVAVSYHAIKAALVNPADTLKYE